MYRYKKIKLANGDTIDEHRLVMQQYLDRDLDTEEVVHHCNGNKLDNRIENLDIMWLPEHSSMHHNLPITHGISRYKAGCRCDKCRKAKSKESHETYLRRKQRKVLMGIKRG